MKLTRILSASVLAGTVILSTVGCSAAQTEEPGPTPVGITATKYDAQHGNPVPENLEPATQTEEERAAPIKLPAKIVVEEDSGEVADELGSIDYIDDSVSEEEITDESYEETVEDTSAAEAAAEAANAVEAVKVSATLNDFYAFVLNPASFDQIINAGSRFSGRSEVTEKELVQFAKDYATIFRHYDTSTPENIQNSYTEIAVASALGKNAPGVITITIPTEAITMFGEQASVDVSMATITVNGKDYSAEASQVATGTIDMIKLETGAWVIQPTTP